MIGSHTNTQMTVQQAVSHLQGRAQQTCDALGNHGRGTHWSVQDATAVTLISRRLGELERMAVLVDEAEVVA